MSNSPDKKLYELIKENIICCKYMNVINVQKQKIASVKYLKKKNAISQWSAEKSL